MNFAELSLNPFLVKALAEKGYLAPTPVQEQAIPAALSGRDLLVSSQTGSGKTAAFVLPSLHRLTENQALPGVGPRLLVLVPTRELAMQVLTAAQAYGRQLRRLRCVGVVGGTAYGRQLKELSAPVDVVVATPGRLLDLVSSGRLQLNRVETLVLDEADRMLDMGFIEDIEAIIARTPTERQTLLFSATLEGVVGRLASRVTRNPQRIEIAPPPATEALIDQRLHYADDRGHKGRLLDSLLRLPELTQALVFAATKRGADDLAAVLCEQGFAAAALHGDMTQGSRSATIRALRTGRTRVLVATDVAARGIDVPGISHVINFDLPQQAEDYVHRIGRTGRAGRGGVAVTLAIHGERHKVRLIERFVDRPIPVSVIPGLEPTARPAHARPGFGPQRTRNGPPARGRDGFAARPGGYQGHRSGRDTNGWSKDRASAGHQRKDSR